MSFLPIVSRELRGASRRRGTYWVRTLVAGAAVFIGVVIFLATVGTAVSTSGEIVFEGLAGLLFLYCLVSGRRSTVDCLSVEKREGTLGLLFLTDLKGYDVVLGKLVATSLNGFYGLLAVMPVLAFSMLLGGISNAEFWRMALVLADTFLFSLAIGIFSSSVSRDARRATSLNFALLLFFLGVLPAVMGIVAYFDPAHQVIPQLFYTCPVFPFILCFDVTYIKHPENFWWSAGVIHALTWLLVILASVIVTRAWQDKPAQGKQVRVRNFWQALSLGPTAGRAAYRRRLLDVNAFYWLAGRARFKPFYVWLFLGAMAGWWVWGLLSEGQFWLREVAVVVIFALLINTTLKFWITLEACQQLAEDQRMGTLELMLPTPLGVRDILRGQALALRRQFLGPLAAAITVEVILVATALQPTPGNDPGPQFLFTAAAGLVTLLVDLNALRWVAMRLALTAKSASRAALGAVARVLFLPWVAYGAVQLAIGVRDALWADSAWQPGWQFNLWLWFGLGIVVDLYFGLRARHQLLTGFRQLALHRYNAKTSFFARWFGNAADAAASALPAAEKPIRRPWWRRKRFAFGVVLVLLASALLTVRINTEHKYPPPVVVSITQSNTPLCISPGNTAFLVLPDGSLWRWGLNQFGRQSEVEVPERVGDGQDWVQIIGDNGGGLGLRRDGTLWGWGFAILPSRPAISEPTQIGTDHDWASVAMSGSHSLAIKRDGSLWAWGDNRYGQLGNGLETNQTNAVKTGANPNTAANIHTNMVQSGTDRNWAAVGCPMFLGTLGLRTDGTLWVWGATRSAVKGFTAVATNGTATQVCSDTNWTSIETAFGYVSTAWNASGELWELPAGRPDAKTDIVSTGRLILSQSGPGRMAVAYTGRLKVYQVRNNGTLWEADNSAIGFGISIASAWRQAGTRSDWVSLWGRRNAAFGLTADGTIWTWGLDYSRKPEIPFSARLQQLQAEIGQIFNQGRPVFGLGATTPFVEKPRPLMRLVMPGAGRPANENGK